MSHRVFNSSGRGCNMLKDALMMDFEAGRMWRAAPVTRQHTCDFCHAPMAFARKRLLFLMSESNFQKRPVVHHNDECFLTLLKIAALAAFLLSKPVNKQSILAFINQPFCKRLHPSLASLMHFVKGTQ